MIKAKRVHHCICVLSIIFFVWSYHTKPGIYQSFLGGNADIFAPDESELQYYYHVKFEAETKPKWEWTLPHNFSYDHVDLTIDDQTKATIFFPSLTCEYGTKQATFTKQFLKELLTVNSEFDKIVDEQLDELFRFILSAGEGIPPPPRHHPYHLDSPYRASYVHFHLGGDLPPFLGVLLLATGIILHFIAYSRKKRAISLDDRPQAQKQLSFMLVVVFINYGIFTWGVFLNNFGGTIDKFGAYLCENTYIIGTILIPISIFYSFVRRFATRARQWDFYGPYISILFYFIITLFLRTPHYSKILNQLRIS